MTDTACRIDGCERQHRARGWCELHWRRWKNHGDPLTVKTTQVLGPPEVRFFAKVDERADGCWYWTAYLDPESGYGTFLFQGRQVRVHRWSYEHFVGPIPEGLHLDHLCRVRHCVNPSHLEPVTQRENTLRGESRSAKNAQKTHCKRGHALSGENLRVRLSTGHRTCRTCARMMDREWKRRQKAIGGGAA